MIPLIITLLLCAILGGTALCACLAASAGRPTPKPRSSRGNEAPKTRYWYRLKNERGMLKFELGKVTTKTTTYQL
jgi:hypothetical protein